MHVSQLLNSLMITEYIEIVIALLPNRLIHLLPTLRQRRAKAWARLPTLRQKRAKGRATHTVELARAYLLQHLQCNGQTGAFRLTQQQMHVLRHHDIADNVQVIPAPYALERLLKHVSRKSRIQVLDTVI